MIKNILNEAKKIFIFGKDINSKYLFCNETVAEAAGLDSPKQIVGKTDDDLFWRSYAVFYRQCDQNVLRGKPFINEQIPFTQPTKIISTILSCETILSDKKGYPKGVTGHAIDVIRIFSIGTRRSDVNLGHLKAPIVKRRGIIDDRP